jgi:hypothetical protein
LQYADLSAQITAGLQRDEVLREAGVSIEDWEAAQTTWPARMARDSAAGRHALAERYAKIFLQRLGEAALTRRRPRPSLEGPLPSPPVVERSPVIALDALRVEAASSPRAPQSPSVAPSAPMPIRTPLPIPASGSVPAPASRTPSVLPPAPGAPRLTLEQFAAMRAELVLAPEPEHPAIVGRYGLAGEAWAAEEQQWQRLLASDRAIFERYLQRFQYMRGLFAR